MIDCKRLAIERFISEVDSAYEETYGPVGATYNNFIGWVARLVLENIANSDMLYHDVEHTMLVTLAGQEILRGKHLSEGGVRPEDWIHFMMAVLCHDIGYVKGVCRDDKEGVYATGVNGTTVELPKGGTNAALTPYSC